MAALKVEVTGQKDDGMLKIEADVLKLDKQPECSFLAITLCDAGRPKLKETNKTSAFSYSPTLQDGIHCLFSIKELHEYDCGHEDIKPGNCLLGSTNFDSQMLYLVDFGMVRLYAHWETTRWITHRPRKRVVMSWAKVEQEDLMLVRNENFDDGKHFKNEPTDGEKRSFN
ncbi:Protein kinase domain-containing protein [Aphelenchoides besseyi]|nr:Protein kinase domain-containing protein [Aphelenchoides besseyi]